MSFSGDVKKELSGQISGARHCQIAELAALMRFCADVRYDAEGNGRITFRSDHERVVRKYRLLLNRLFKVRSEIYRDESGKRALYCLDTAEPETVRKILRAVGEGNAAGSPSAENARGGQDILRRACCRRAYLRGAFLAAGSVSDPSRSYHFEIVCGEERMAEDLAVLMRSLDVDGRVVKRRKYYVAYVKESSQISDLLALMEAPVSMLNFENIRVVRNVRGNVNRKVNCETANINKTANAAARQISDIEYIDRVMGISELPNGLDEMARIRLQYPTATLNELGELLDPPVGKSGVNHRLRRLSRIAERLKEGEGGIF
jgi:DNA-binding protein WhiA